MDRALDDVISERQVGTMLSPREQSTAADGGHSEKKPAGGQKKSLAQRRLKKGPYVLLI